VTGDHAARRIDVARLPEDVVALIDGLGLGEDLVVTRDGNSIATITSTVGALDDAVTDPDDPDEAVETTERPPTDDDDVTVVATAMKLSASARVSLSAELGTDYVVLDMHKAPRTADVLLVPPVSPQLIEKLRSLYPKARVVVAEIEDRELGVSYQGPVRRMLDAGAETYLSTTTMPRLARQLDRAVTQRPQLTAGTTARLEIESAAEPPDVPA
jgi:hypothetical protein